MEYPQKAILLKKRLIVTGTNSLGPEFSEEPDADMSLAHLVAWCRQNIGPDTLIVLHDAVPKLMALGLKPSQTVMDTFLLFDHPALPVARPTLEDLAEHYEISLLPWPDYPLSSLQGGTAICQLLDRIYTHGERLAARKVESRLTVVAHRHPEAPILGR